MSRVPDLYRVLKIRRSATPDEIEKAYARRAKDTHPDRGGDRAAFERVRLAYEVLIDSERRSRYDATGDTTARPQSDEDLQLIRILSACLSAVLKETVERGGSVDQLDIVALMRKSLADGARAQLREHRKGLEHGRAALAVSVDRFQVDEGDNLIAGIARVQMQQLDDQLKAVNDELARVEKAVELLKRYRYKFDKFASLFTPGSWRPTATTTASSMY